MTLLVILLVLVLILSLLLVVPRTSGAESRARETEGDGIDHEELESAERELDNLRATATPDDADDELPDWGPGAPKYDRGASED